MRGWPNSWGLSQVSGSAVNEWFVKLLYNKVPVSWTVRKESLLSFFSYSFCIIELCYALCEAIFCSFKFKLLCSRCYHFFITFKVCWVLPYSPVLVCGVEEPCIHNAFVCVCVCKHVCDFCLFAIHYLHVCVAEPQTAVLISLKLIVQYVKDKYA